MATIISRLRATASVLGAQTLQTGVIAVDLTNNDLRLFDGTTLGGHRILNKNTVETMISSAKNDVLEEIVAATDGVLDSIKELETPGLIYQFADGTAIPVVIPSSSYLSLTSGTSSGNPVLVLDSDTLTLNTAGGVSGGGAFGNSLTISLDTNWLGDFVEAIVKKATPPGTIQFFAMATPPDGWSLADGLLLSKTEYPELFAAIGHTYSQPSVISAGTHFAKPDIRGAVLRALDSGRGIDPGRAFGTLQYHAMENHVHSVSDPGHHHLLMGTTNGVVGGTNNLGPGSGSNYDLTSVTKDSLTGITVGLPSAAPGFATPRTATETRMTNFSQIACVKLGKRVI